MDSRKPGHIVWHDLFTSNTQTSKSFYERVAGWQYVTEHASDFAWGGGENDVVLALTGDEAGAVFVEQHQVITDAWIPYIEVNDVPAAADLAVNLGAMVEKPPFDVPGVGTNCLLRDPLGAMIGVCLSSHGFPIPSRQFSTERYLTRVREFPADFYSRMFDWRIQTTGNSQGGTTTIKHGEDVVAACLVSETFSNLHALWVPGIRVSPLSDALQSVRSLNGSVLTSRPLTSTEAVVTLIRDPNGALSYLLEH